MNGELLGGPADMETDVAPEVKIYHGSRFGWGLLIALIANLVAVVWGAATVTRDVDYLKQEVAAVRELQTTIQTNQNQMTTDVAVLRTELKTHRETEETSRR